MSHDLAVVNGKVSMFYVGETPWHELGTKLDAPATAAEAITAAGLDFRVQKFPNIHLLPNGENIVSASSFFTVRTDTMDVLGSRLGAWYTVLQNADAFSFFDTHVGAGEAIYHTAGALGKGERIWILAKMPEYIHVRVNGHDDPVEKFVLLANSHDGSLTVKTKLTPVRVVCNNTLSVALWSGDTTKSVMHTKGVKGRVEQTAEALGLYNKLYSELEVAMQAMAAKQMDEMQIFQYVKKVVQKSEPDEVKTTVLTGFQEKVMDQVMELVETGKGSFMARGTLWGAYNAVTEFADHVRTSSTQTDEAMLRTTWFGGSREKMKFTAFNLALGELN